MAQMIKIDASDFNEGIKALNPMAQSASTIALSRVCDEVLRLSSFEVPHDTGWLQGHGAVLPLSENEVLVGYNTPYAARLHEHPEYNFQKGRKGKYLEDPIKNNLNQLGLLYAKTVETRFSK